MKIDIVIPWVDGADPVWQADKARHSPEVLGDNQENRYRDFDNLQYLFRSIEKNAPWVNKIFFITYGHLPEWLNTDNPKLRIVNHKDFIPAEYLPTFSVNPIELNLHRIEELSEHFVYFNDDTFLTKAVTEVEFFKHGLPCDMGVLEAFTTKEDFSYIPHNNMRVINKYFNKQANMKKNIFKWFNLKYKGLLYRNIALYPWKVHTGFYNHHMPSAHLKRTYREVWEKESDVLHQTSLHKFRTLEDVSAWLFRYWRLAKSEFHPHVVKGKYFSVNSLVVAETVAEELRNPKHTFICINDTVTRDFEEIKTLINASLERAFNEKSSYEK